MLSEAHAKRFQERGIDPETAVKFGIYTERLKPTGSAVVFPFTEGGEIVNRKHRAPDKRFWQDAGAKKTFWNADALKDPLLEDGAAKLIITEGEFDALTAIECGFPLTVSVPDGAPPQALEGEIDPNHDDKFKFIWNNWEALSKVKRIILAVDDDGPGRALAAELVRRLGAVRCLFIEYPENCKDLNDVLVTYGQDEVVRVLNQARPYPVKGLHRMSDFPEVPEAKTFSTGWVEMDEFFTPFLGEFIVITGIPNHGKSTWTNAMVCNLVKAHGLNATFASFENNPMRDLRPFLRKQHGGTDADKWINDRFSFLYQDPRELDEDGDLDWLIDRAADSVIRYGSNILVVDPWNEIEHKRRHGESETEYVGRAIRELKRFGRSYEVMTVVVAHPVKMGGGQHGMHKPNLYDISGSANWYNKADHGIVVWRPDIGKNVIEVDSKKVRFDWSGKPGKVNFQYNKQLTKFESIPEELVI